MRVEIIDDTHQRFNGVNYRRNKRGWYQTPYTALHIEVWKFHRGDIPKGYEIHHVDCNKDNNQIENLQCVTRAEHVQIHLEIKRAQGLIAPKKPSLICSRCGKSFTSEAKEPPDMCAACRRELAPPKPKPQKKVKPFHPPRYRHCVVCGKIFPVSQKESWTAGNHGRKTCSKECHDKICAPITEKTCPICGKLFKGQHSWQRTCSPECGAKWNGLNRRELELRTCPVCGKIYMPKAKRQKACCRQCSQHNRHAATKKASEEA